MTLKLYCGIGPRKTPPTVLAIMAEIASQLASAHWTLRSGHGAGADQAFGAGVSDSSQKHIYLPFAGYNNAGPYSHFRLVNDNDRIRRIAAMHHTKYETMRPAYQRLMDRNVNIILGDDGDLPPEMVIYWQSEEGAEDYFGGTNHSIRIAKTFGIPTFNIRLDAELEALVNFVNQKDA